MSAAELMADDGGDELESVAQSAKRSAFWHGVLEGLGGPALMGLSSEDVRHHPRVASAYRQIFTSAFKVPNPAYSSQKIDQRVAEAFYKALAEAIEKKQLNVEQITGRPTDLSKKMGEALVQEINKELRDYHGDR